MWLAEDDHLWTFIGYLETAFVECSAENNKETHACLSSDENDRYMSIVCQKQLRHNRFPMESIDKRKETYDIEPCLYSYFS